MEFRREPLCGCRGTPTPTSLSPRFKPCCCGPSHGREKSRSTSWWTTSQRLPRCREEVVSIRGAASTKHMRQMRTSAPASLMRFPGHCRPAASDQKIEIRTLVGLGHSINVQLLISALHCRLRLSPLGSSGLQLFLGNIEMKLSRFHVQFDHVAVSNQRERAANRGLWSDVEDHSSVGGPAH